MDEEVPGPPRNLSVLRSTENSVTFRWAPPASSRSIVSGYVFVVEIGKTRPIPVENKKLTATEYTVQNLTPGKSYSFKVAAVGPDGQGDFVKHTSGEPGAPTDFIITSSTSSNISLKWDKPDTDSWPPITGYILMVAELRDDQEFLVETQVLTAKQTSYAFNKVNLSKSYIFKVAARNVTGQGKFALLHSSEQCSPSRSDTSFLRPQSKQPAQPRGKSVVDRIKVLEQKSDRSPSPVPLWKRIPENKEPSAVNALEQKSDRSPSPVPLWKRVPEKKEPSAVKVLEQSSDRSPSPSPPWKPVPEKKEPSAVNALEQKSDRSPSPVPLWKRVHEKKVPAAEPMLQSLPPTKTEVPAAEHMLQSPTVPEINVTEPILQSPPEPDNSSTMDDDNSNMYITGAKTNVSYVSEEEYSMHVFGESSSDGLSLESVGETNTDEITTGASDIKPPETPPRTDDTEGNKPPDSGPPKTAPRTDDMKGIEAVGPLPENIPPAKPPRTFGSDRSRLPPPPAPPVLDPSKDIVDDNMNVTSPYDEALADLLMRLGLDRYYPQSKRMKIGDVLTIGKFAAGAPPPTKEAEVVQHILQKLLSLDVKATNFTVSLDPKKKKVPTATLR